MLQNRFSRKQQSNNRRLIFLKAQTCIMHTALDTKSSTYDLVWKIFYFQQYCVLLLVSSYVQIALQCGRKRLLKVKKNICCLNCVIHNMVDLICYYSPGFKNFLYSRHDNKIERKKTVKFWADFVCCCLGEEFRFDILFNNTFIISQTSRQKVCRTAKHFWNYKKL